MLKPAAVLYSSRAVLGAAQVLTAGAYFNPVVVPSSSGGVGRITDIIRK